MGQRSIIWRNKLEDYVMELFNNQRKTYIEIAEIITKEKGIAVSREAVKNFINKEISARQN
jgi:hypothetical protein